VLAELNQARIKLQGPGASTFGCLVDARYKRVNEVGISDDL
jgi:hypothetical protein